MTSLVAMYGFLSGAPIGPPRSVSPYVSPPNILGTRMGMTWTLAGIALLETLPLGERSSTLKAGSS